MYKQSFKRAMAATAAALLLTAGFAGAQNEESILRITRPHTSQEDSQKLKTRTAPVANVGRDASFARIHPEIAARSSEKNREKNQRRQRAQSDGVSAFARTRQ